MWDRRDAPVEQASLTAMAAALRHRGPDADGFWTDAGLGLAHRRLSVIDVSAAGRQPIGSEDDGIQVCYNGEIYNFAEIRDELIGRGHQFRSRTDTEVIAHAWEEWGAQAVTRFNGMFAFAVWQARDRRLWLVRDRLGVKPLYYAWQAGRLIFGSEIKALLAVPGMTRTLDPVALDAFLALNYVPGPRTIWREIQQLPPGHILSATANGHALEPYWDVRFGVDRLTDRAETVERIRTLCDDAVRLRLVSDVPLGAFLSGGLDSSAIVHFMRPRHAGPLHTFSVRFDETSFDEGPYAALVARTYDLQHHEVVCRAADVPATLDRIVWHADAPVADISMVPMYMLARATREHVTVVLSGDGGDEVFGGYSVYQADRLARVWRSLPRWLRERLIIPIVDALPASTGKMSADYALRQFVAGAGESRDIAHYSWRTIASADQRARLLQPDVHAEATRDQAPESPFLAAARASGTEDLLDRCFHVDLKTFLADSILPKVDRMTMAFGLEARTPWLDYRLVELGARIPPAWKLSGLDTKVIFKDAMRGLVPDPIVSRRKAGFHAPLAAWFRGPLQPLLRESLSPEALRVLPELRPGAVQQLVDQHIAGRANHAFKLWGLVTLVRWAHT
ncbi:MAG: asparagine synthase (glutamine-hydrolyzing), partial [Acidobacteria bacterium]|nr:asparagine synthase (glutamine-hydrolyzing) [Acidobacteriota bacterium]